MSERAEHAEHAHAVLHCNLNTVDLARAEAFYTTLFDVEPRMRSVSAGSDATPMGLPASTDSVTAFLYDRRGPRAAPALELVGWRKPATVLADADPAATGFTAAGFRVPALAPVSQRLTALGRQAEPVPGGLWVRGAFRPALRTTDYDGVEVEIVEIARAVTDPETGLISHERIRCADLAARVSWYAGIGFTVRAGDEIRASLVLPEDPTFSLEIEQAPRLGSAVSRSAVNRAANTQGLYRIALAVDDVRAAHAGLRAAGHATVPEPSFIPMPDVPTGGFTVLFLRDQDGNVVELVERPRSAMRRPAEPR